MWLRSLSPSLWAGNTLPLISLISSHSELWLLSHRDIILIMSSATLVQSYWETIMISPKMEPSSLKPCWSYHLSRSQKEWSSIKNEIFWARVGSELTLTSTTWRKGNVEVHFGSSKPKWTYSMMDAAGQWGRALWILIVHHSWQLNVTLNRAWLGFTVLTLSSHPEKDLSVAHRCVSMVLWRTAICRLSTKWQLG